MCRFGFLDEEDSLWVNHLRGRDMLEAGWKTLGPENHPKWPANQNRVEIQILFIVCKFHLNRDTFIHQPPQKKSKCLQQA